MSARWATTGVFVVNGAAIGTWVAQIPWIQDRFDLSRSAMGLVITGMAISVILGEARVVFLDASTTNLEVARHLPADPPRTILTNSPPIAAALADHPTADVVMIGGRLNKSAQVTVGPTAVDFVRSVRADAVVLGVCALHPDAGLSTDDLEEAHVKRAMVEASADVIALSTSDKLRAGSPYVVAPVAELTHVVAEAAAPDELLDPYRALGVTVTRA